jgi:hypothetical protein
MISLRPEINLNKREEREGGGREGEGERGI